MNEQDHLKELWNNQREFLRRAEVLLGRPFRYSSFFEKWRYKCRFHFREDAYISFLTDYDTNSSRDSGLQHHSVLFCIEGQDPKEFPLDCDVEKWNGQMRDALAYFSSLL